MNFDYDVVIIGGAFSGAATALMLKRKRPEARVLIIEKTTAFDRKVGESTTEVSSCYMTRILGLTHYLGHHQLPKQGLRLWFSNRSDQPFDDCVEVGTRYQSRLPGFQVDRAKLDSHMLDLACRLGCDLWRPAKVTGFELNDGSGQTVNAVVDGEERTAACRWIVDALRQQHSELDPLIGGIVREEMQTKGGSGGRRIPANNAHLPPHVPVLLWAIWSNWDATTSG